MNLPNKLTLLRIVLIQVYSKCLMPYSSAMGFREVRQTCLGFPKNSVTLGRRTVSPGAMDGELTGELVEA